MLRNSSLDVQGWIKKALATSAAISLLSFGIIAIHGTSAQGSPDPSTAVTLNTTKIVKLTSGKIRIRVDLADNLRGKKVLIRTTRIVDGKRKVVTLGRVTLDADGKGVLTVQKKIRIGDRLVVSDGTKNILSSKVTAIESPVGADASSEAAPGITSPPQGGAPNPTPSPTPSSTPTVSGGGQNQNSQTRTSVSAVVSTTPSVSARSQLSSSLQTTPAVAQRNSLTYSLATVPHDPGRDLVATATVVTAGTNVANSPPEVRKIEIRGDLAVGDTFDLSGNVTTEDTAAISGLSQAELFQSLITNFSDRLIGSGLSSISAFEESGKRYLLLEWCCSGVRSSAVLLNHRAGKVSYRSEVQTLTLSGNLVAGDIFTLVANGFTMRSAPIQGTTQAELTTDLASKLLAAHTNGRLFISSPEQGKIRVVFEGLPVYDAPDANLTQNAGQTVAVGETQTLTLSGDLVAGDEFSLLANGFIIQSGPIQGTDQQLLAANLAQRLRDSRPNGSGILFISAQGVDQNGFLQVQVEFTTAAGNVPDSSLTQTVGQLVAAGEEQTLNLNGNLVAGDEFSLVAGGNTIQSGPLQGANQTQLISDLASKLNAANPGGSTIASISSQGAGVLKIVFAVAAGDVSNATLTHTRVAG